MNFFLFGNKLSGEEIMSPFTHEERVALLLLWGTPEIQQAFDSATDRESVWKTIARKMSSSGYGHTWAQYKDQIDLLMEEFYYINSVECTLPNEIVQNWVYTDYLKQWLSSSDIPVIKDTNTVKPLLKQNDETYQNIHTNVTEDTKNETRTLHRISHLDIIKARIMKHVRFQGAVDQSPARREEFFDLGSENKRKCCNIL